MKPVFSGLAVRLLLPLLFSFIFLQMATAAISSKQSGSWTSASTWEGGAVPSDNDDVIIKSGHTVTRNNAFVSHGYLYVYGTLVYTGNVAREYYFGNSIEIDGTLRMEGGTFKAGGIVYGDGTFRQTAGSTNFERAYVLGYTDIQGGSVLFQNINNGNLYLDFLTLKNATLEVQGTEDLIIRNSMVWSSGGKLVPGSILKIQDGASLTFDNGGTRYNDAIIENEGTIYSGTGALSALTGTGIIFNRGHWESNVPSGTMTVSKQTLYNTNSSSFLKKGAGSIVFAPSSQFSMDYNTASFYLQQGNFTMKPTGVSVLGGTWQIDSGCNLTFTDDGSNASSQFFGPTFTNNGQVKGALLRFTSSYVTTLGGDGSFEKVEIAKTGGEVTLAGSPQITQIFNLTNGNIVLNQYDLRLGSASVSFAIGNDSYIKTNGTGGCIRVCPPNSATTFPIGNEESAPLVMQLSAGSTQDFIKVRGADYFYGEYTGNNPACSSEIPVGVVAHNWFVSEQTPGGSVASVAVYWLPNAERNGFDRNACTLGNYAGGDWHDNGFYPAFDVSPFSGVQATNLTAFGLFGVYNQAHESDVNFAAPAPAGNNPVCEWDDLQLHANTSQNADIQWTGPNGYQSTESDPLVPGIQLSQGGVYVVSASQYGCPEQQATINILVNPLPNASVQGPSLIQSGESATLTAFGGVSYAWNTGAATQSITVAPTQTSDYQVSVTSQAGCVDVALHTIQVSGATATKEAGNSFRQMKIAPNPAVDAAILTFDASTSGAALLILTDARGAQLLQQQVSIISGRNELPIPLIHFPAGTYQVTLIRENEVKTTRLVKLMGE